MTFKKTICVDFDGVIHKYSKGWHTGQIYDEPVEGAIDWLLRMDHENYDVCIYSSRSKEPHGIQAMKDWLSYWIGEGSKSVTEYQDHWVDDEMFNITKIEHTRIRFPTQKPAAWLTIDDRAICFDGTFPTFEEINDFTPWNKK